MNEHTAPHHPTSDTPSLRVGVIICECGGKIGQVFDTELLRHQAAALPEVVYAARDAYPCSKDGQARLRQAIAEQRLDRVLIAGCAPRLVEKLFRRTAQSAGLDGGYLEVTNIREQCAYVHDDGPLALQKAADLIEMGVARLDATMSPTTHTGRVVKSAMVIGSDLSGLTMALSLADNHIPVTLVERADTLGGLPYDRAGRAQELTTERIEAASRHPRLTTMLGAHVTQVTGHPGDYEVQVAQNGRTTTFAVGVIIVATGARQQELDINRWYDRSRVMTQARFEQELDAGKLFAHDIVMILCEQPAEQRCSRVCCADAIRQAVRVKQSLPGANVTILFRALCLGNEHMDELQEAVRLGVTFFRYRQDPPPQIGDKTIDVHDPLTGEPLRLPYDCAVMATSLVPEDHAAQLAALLRLPQDEAGFMIEPRIRLRPGRYTDDGVYVLGGAHQPATPAEALFQAYMASTRVMRFLSQDLIQVQSPVAQIDSKLCTGCGNCVQVCPMAAVALEKQDGVLSLSEIDPLRCTGCGNCVVVCPVKAITLPGWDDAEILAQISAALRPRHAEGATTTKVVALACEWSAYAAADMAGAQRFPSPHGVRIIRMNCSARFDPYHILWAFVNGADGVFLGACPPGECHYGFGNLYAQERVEVLKKLLAERGIDPRRLRLEFISGDDGKQFAKIMTSFVNELGTLVADPWRLTVRH